MSLRQKLRDEIKAVVLTTLYFAVWIGMLVLIKKLVLAQYQIAFEGLSAALFGALILAKVVLVLEHVPLRTWFGTRPAWVDVLLRTVMYSVGVLVVLLLEKAYEGRHAPGGFSEALLSVFRNANMYHVWANLICISGALLSYNVLSVVRGHLGKGGLLHMFMIPPPEPISESDLSARSMNADER